MLLDGRLAAGQAVTVDADSEGMRFNVTDRPVRPDGRTPAYTTSGLIGRGVPPMSRRDLDVDVDQLWSGSTRR